MSKGGSRGTSVPGTPFEQGGSFGGSQRGGASSPQGGASPPPGGDEEEVDADGMEAEAMDGMDDEVRMPKVNSPTKSSTCCLLLLIKILSRRLCGGVDFLKLIDKYIVPDKLLDPLYLPACDTTPLSACLPACNTTPMPAVGTR